MTKWMWTALMILFFSGKFLGIFAGIECFADDEPIIPSSEIEAILTRGIEVVPKIDDQGYTTPETSSHISLSSIQFKINSAELSGAAVEQLDQVVQALKTIEGRSAIRMSDSTGTLGSPRVMVEGHTCDLGTPQHNRELSDRRAQTVREYLIQKGIDPHRLESRGWGQERPVVSNANESQRSRNRRVDFVYRRPGGRGVKNTTTSKIGLLDVQFEAWPRDLQGRKISNDQIERLHSGDKFSARFMVMEGCHVFVLFLSSKRTTDWLAFDTPEGEGWRLDTVAQAAGQYGFWCYYGDEHFLPNRTQTYVLNEDTGREALCIIASRQPVPDPMQLPRMLLEYGNQLTAETLKKKLGWSDIEVHLLFFEHI